MRNRLLVVLALPLLGGIAHADTRAHEDAERARFERYAGAPIEQFPMYSLWKYQVVGPEHVVLWSTVKDAFLVRVALPCNRLEWTHGLSVTQRMRQQVSRKFDFIAFGDERCEIVQILPVDYQRMLKDGKDGQPQADTSPDKS